MMAIRIPARSTIRKANQLVETPPTHSHQQPAVTAAAAIDGDDAALTLKQPHRLQYGARLESWRPRDPFDPEIFNRLQRSPARTASAAAPATAAEQR
jgi:hypothetical protein